MQVRGEELQTFVRDELILGKDNLHPLQKKKLFPYVEKKNNNRPNPNKFSFSLDVLPHSFPSI